MKREGPQRTPESQPPPIVYAPAVETLALDSDSKSPWSEGVRENISLREAVEERKTLLSNINSVFSRLPKAETDVYHALASGQLDEKEIISLYDSLGKFLEQGDDTRRLALYLPFEILPSRIEAARSPEFEKKAEKFAEVYMMRWHELLHVRDVRANFADGDVLETEYRDGALPRVVKAAHLIPKLVERKLLSLDEVIHILNTTHDDTLRGSVADALLVLGDMKLVSEWNVHSMSQSRDPFVVELSRILSSSTAEQVEVRTNKPYALSISHVTARLLSDLEGITLPEAHMSKARADWLRAEKTRHLIDTYAHSIEPGLRSSTITLEDLRNTIRTTDSPEVRQAIVASIGQVLEGSAKNDVTRARSEFEAYASILDELHTDAGVADTVATIYVRLGNAGVLTPEEMEKLEIYSPELSGPFSKNIASMSREVREIATLTHAIESNKQLSECIYPVSLFFGSRVKGYGTQSSDVDMAVFVRPGTSFGQRSQLQALLKEHFTHEKVQGKIVEFWLQDTDGHLKVIDEPNPDSSLGDSTWAHVLFGAAWTGDSGVVKELHEKLLTPYLQNTEKKVQGRPARGVWLEEMERDALQYRLMHKGYARFHSKQGGIHTPNADAIDGDSTFWDSGYRRVATKLFVHRVFLPEIDT